MTDKRVLRSRILAQREALSEDQINTLSLRVITSLRESNLLAQSARVMAYIRCRGEVDLSLLFDWLEHREKRLAFPKVASKIDGWMQPYYIGKPWRNNLALGAFNILEPSGDINPADPAQLDLVLVPGVAFDRDLYRIGFGGGFYDRFLPRLGAHSLKIGIAYQFQLVSKVPRDTHDIPLDGVCTEQGLFLK